jgi:hypothetical protein
MKRSLSEIENLTKEVMNSHRHASIADDVAARSAWLHGAGYNGVSLIVEALQDIVTTTEIEKDLMGLDLKNVSCVFIARDVEAQYAAHGRLFLRNVRHGLYLLPGSVAGHYGIGCPVDPSFALGGERLKNPYSEKIELATSNGVDIEESVWQALSDLKF